VGDYVTFLDSDDELNFQMIGKCLAKFRTDPEVEVVYGWIGVLSSNNSIVPGVEFNLEGYIYGEVLKQGYKAPLVH
jgi:cellulose synthase/poly-beta-1,6-N-acetylglucosamine synthase-like glycosyltransferase